MGEVAREQAQSDLKRTSSNFRENFVCTVSMQT